MRPDCPAAARLASLGPGPYNDGTCRRRGGTGRFSPARRAISTLHARTARLVDPGSPQYEAAHAFLLARIDFERMLSIPYGQGEFWLDRMRELAERLGNPQEQLRIVHVAGTKGKGSTAATIAAILTASGRRTGLYSSPHLERLEERISVDGQPCPPADLIGLVERVRPAVEAMDRGAGPARMARPISRSSPLWPCCTSSPARSTWRCSKWGWEAGSIRPTSAHRPWP